MSNPTKKVLDGTDRWKTPDLIVGALQEYLDIDLDPCAGLHTFIGTENWTIEEDGEVYREDGNVLRTDINSLDRTWDVDTDGDNTIAFINPPFSYKGDFIEKTLDEMDAGRLDGAIVLTPDSTDVKSWWHNKLRPRTPVVWFSKGRISFIDPDSGKQKENPTFGTALHFVGDVDVWNRTLFDHLNKMGEVDVRWEHISAFK